MTAPDRIVRYEIYGSPWMPAVEPDGRWVEYTDHLAAIAAIAAARAEGQERGLLDADMVDWSTGKDVSDKAPAYLSEWQRGFVAGQASMRDAIRALIPTKETPNE